MGNYFCAQTVTRKAAKRHECDECYDGINDGDTYHIDAGVFDGAFYRTKMCDRCKAAIAKAFALDRFDNGYTIGGFWNTVSEWDDRKDWNMPREWSHRLEVWLTPDVWMTRWGGVPELSSDRDSNKHYQPHGWGDMESARKAVAKLDPDGTRFPGVEYRWVEVADG